MATTICSSVKSSLPAWQCSPFPDLLHCSHPGFSLSRQELQRRGGAARSVVTHWPRGKGEEALSQALRFLGVTRVLHGAPRRQLWAAQAPDFQAVSSLMDLPPCGKHPRDVCFAASQPQVLRVSRHSACSRDPLPRCERMRWWTLPRQCIHFIAPIKS